MCVLGKAGGACEGGPVVSCCGVSASSGETGRASAAAATGGYCEVLCDEPVCEYRCVRVCVCV